MNHHELSVRASKRAARTFYAHDTSAAELVCTCGAWVCVEYASPADVAALAAIHRETSALDAPAGEVQG